MVSFLNDTSLYFDESIQPLFFLKPSNPADGPTRVSIDLTAFSRRLIGLTLPLYVPCRTLLSMARLSSRLAELEMSRKSLLNLSVFHSLPSRPKVVATASAGLNCGSISVADVHVITTVLVIQTGKQSMWIAGRHESYETLRRTITLTPGWLEAGEHRFGWSIIVPANTA